MINNSIEQRRGYMGFGYARNSAIEGGISEIIYYSYPGNSKGFNDYGHQIDQSKKVNACYVQNACYPTNSNGGNNLDLDNYVNTPSNIKNDPLYCSSHSSPYC